MKTRESLILSVFIIFLTYVNSALALPMVYDDLWDVSQGTVVTGNSDVHHISHPANIFGNTVVDTHYHEGENTLFRDNQYAGYAHWIEWQTVEPVMINRLNLVASHDSANTNYRAISTFILYSWIGESWNQLYSYNASNPYGGGETYTAGNFLELYDSFPTVSTQKFRAEFVQYSSDGYGLATGPRIHELDGYYIVPEPCGIFLAALGLFRLATRQRS